MDNLASKPEFSVADGQFYYHQWWNNFQRCDQKLDDQFVDHWSDNAGGRPIYKIDGVGRHRRGHVLNIVESIPHVPSRDQIDRLQAEMVKMPQLELQTEHFFVPGMYCRRVYRPAGTLIVGKVHKHPHFFLCAKGEIIAWTESGMRKLQAGDVVECQPGTKRVTLATQDSIGVTIHKTEKTDLDDIETELVEPDDTALFDSGNKLKSIVAEMAKLEQT